MRAPYLWIMVGLVVLAATLAGLSALAITYRMERCVTLVMRYPPSAAPWEAIHRCQSAP